MVGLFDYSGLPFDIDYSVYPQTCNSRGGGINAASKGDRLSTIWVSSGQPIDGNCFSLVNAENHMNWHKLNNAD